jgi:hypothetical protein
MSNPLENKKLCDSLSYEEFDKLVQKYPWGSLEHEHACARLSATQFNECVKKNPGAALIYRHACAQLTVEQFDYCVKKDTDAALRFKHAFARLPQDAITFDNYVKKWPWQALEYEHIESRLNPYQKSWLEKQNHE